MKYLLVGLIVLSFAGTARADGTVMLKPVVVEGRVRVPMVIIVEREKPNIPLHALEPPPQMREARASALTVQAGSAGRTP
jgi:hypothetical protein